MIARFILILLTLFQLGTSVYRRELHGETSYYNKSTYNSYQMLYLVWFDCESDTHGKGVIDELSTWYLEFKTNPIFRSYVELGCLYNDKVNDTTKYKNGDIADTPIIEEKYYTSTTKQVNCKTSHPFFYCRMDPIECNTDYALGAFVMRFSSPYFWYDYTCIAVKSTGETQMYTEPTYTKTFTDIPDVVNYKALAERNLTFPFGTVIQGFQYDFSNKAETGDRKNVTNSFRWHYKTITLRNVTKIKKEYLDDSEQYRINYEKDT